MEQAIKKAIEGGYKPEPFRTRQFIRTSRSTYQHMQFSSASMAYSEILLDALFWQALFKEYISGLPFKIQDRTLPQWRQQWHRFIDCLADGGNADDFFKKLV